MAIIDVAFCSDHAGGHTFADDVEDFDEGSEVQCVGGRTAGEGEDSGAGEGGGMAAGDCDGDGLVGEGLGVEGLEGGVDIGEDEGDATHGCWMMGRRRKGIGEG